MMALCMFACLFDLLLYIHSEQLKSGWDDQLIVVILSKLLLGKPHI